MISNENIIAFGCVDWGTHNTHADAHILRRLARHNRVMYVESVGGRSARASGKDLTRIMLKLRKWITGVKNVAPNFYVVTPLIIPAFQGSQFVERVNQWLYVTQLRYFKWRAQFYRPILWLFLPSAFRAVGHLDEKMCVFHIFDKYHAFNFVEQERVRKWEETLVRNSDVVFACGEVMYREFSGLNENFYLVDHGVEVEHYAKVFDPATPTPEELKGIKHPVIGYFGVMDHDWFDYDLMKFLAAKRPAWTFVLVGPVTEGRAELASYPNVIMTGKKNYSELPNYTKLFDVCLIPFKISPVTRACKPLKLYEYLAAGKPVVSTLVPEPGQYLNVKDVVKYSEDYDEFLRLVEQSLAENTPEWIEKRVKIAQNESWDKRVEEIAEKFEATVSQRQR